MSANPSTGWPFRYELLDGLRGLAALAVAAFHLGLLEGGHYAVMMFFVISGYCIAASTETCRRNGLSFGAFMRRRLRRIYPPYFFAIVFFVLTRILKSALGDGNDLHRSLLDWVQNVTMTQWVSLLFEPRAEAVQNPTLLVAAFWSLNYEEQFYLIMGLALLVAASRRAVISSIVIALAAIGFVWNSVVPGGWVIGFFIEYWAHFALGATLFYVLSIYPGRTTRLVFLFTVAGVCAFCVWQIFPWRPDMLQQKRALVELFVASAFTLMLALLRPLSASISRHWLWKPVAALGLISYSLYLVHQFNLTLAHRLAERLLPGSWDFARALLMLAIELTIGAVFWYLCERPYLNRAKPKQPSSEATSSGPLSPAASFDINA